MGRRSKFSKVDLIIMITAFGAFMTEHQLIRILYPSLKNKTSNLFFSDFLLIELAALASRGGKLFPKSKISIAPEDMDRVVRRIISFITEEERYYESAIPPLPNLPDAPKLLKAVRALLTTYSENNRGHIDTFLSKIVEPSHTHFPGFPLLKASLDLAYSHSDKKEAVRRTIEKIQAGDKSPTLALHALVRDRDQNLRFTPDRTGQPNLCRLVYWQLMNELGDNAYPKDGGFNFLNDQGVFISRDRQFSIGMQWSDTTFTLCDQDGNPLHEWQAPTTVPERDQLTIRISEHVK